MFGKSKKESRFFDDLCEEYYKKVLHYLFAALGDESAARDCTQEVFLTVWQKSSILLQHPNPGGFVFQTAKNFAKKARQTAFRKMLTDPISEDFELHDPASEIEIVRDARINEEEYTELVLSSLSDENLHLYTEYYLCKKSMEEIAGALGIEQPALRMRYVRLRREIRAIAARVAEEYFAV